MTKYYIRDWAGNTKFNWQEFESIDDAELFLSIKLKGKSLEYMQEFYIVPLTF